MTTSKQRVLAHDNKFLLHVCGSVRPLTPAPIDMLGEQGGYVLGPGHTYIQIDAPVENIMAMCATASKYAPFST